MDEITRIADEVQDRFPDCVAMRTCPGRDSVQVSVRWDRRDEWEGTAFRMCDDYLVALADGGDQIADIATYWNDESDAWETSVEVHAVEYAGEHEGRDGGDWRSSEGGGHYRIGDEIDLAAIWESDDE